MTIINFNSMKKNYLPPRVTAFGFGTSSGICGTSNEDYSQKTGSFDTDSD